MRHYVVCIIIPYGVSKSIDLRNKTFFAEIKSVNDCKIVYHLRMTDRKINRKKLIKVERELFFLLLFLFIFVVGVFIINSVVGRI